MAGYDYHPRSKEPSSAALVCTNSWAGRLENPCRIVGETPKKYRIEVDETTELPGGPLQPGERRLVPKTAVRLLPTPETTEGGG